MAVDSETGRVYVADRLNNRVNVFEASGQFAFAFGWGVDSGAATLQTCTAGSGCQAGLPGSGAGQFNRPARVAVDNSPESPSRHDVYVGTDNFRVQKFDAEGHLMTAFGIAGSVGAQGSGPCEFGNLASIQDAIAVGPDGVLYVADSVTSEVGPHRVVKFDSTGTCLAPVAFEQASRSNGALAVDSSGNFYIPRGVKDTGPSITGVTKYGPDGTVLWSREATNPAAVSGLTVDSNDTLFVQSPETIADRGSFRTIFGVSAQGDYLTQFGYDQISNSSLGIAASADGTGIFLSGTAGIALIPFPDPGPISVASTLQPATVGNTKATIRGEINPEGKATQYRIDFVDQQGWEEAGFDSPRAKSTLPASLQIAPGDEFRRSLFEAEIGCPVATKELIEAEACLVPETEYHYRVVATNDDNPTGDGLATAVGAPFKTRPPLDIQATWAQGVGSDSATLRAEVNPLGIQAVGHFEYVDEAAFQRDRDRGGDGFAEAVVLPDESRGELPLDFGASATAAVRGVTAVSLAAGTSYRYRVVVTNPLIESPVFGPVHAVTTYSSPTLESCPANDAFRKGASALLPDCRAYEMVSPLNKNNGDIIALRESLTSLRGVLNRSSASGGRLAYGSYRSFGDAEAAPFTTQYIAARHAGVGWDSHAISPPIGRLVVPTIPASDTEFKAFSSDLCEAWMITIADPPLTTDAVPGYRNLYRRTDQACGLTSYEALTPVAPPTLSGDDYLIELLGLSADGTHAIFTANDKLSSEGTAGGFEVLQLYESVRGSQPRFVCVLPNGTPFTGACNAGTTPTPQRDSKSRRATVVNAISDDGSRIFWTDSSGTWSGLGKIYVRMGTETVAVSAGAEVLSGASSSRYWAAAANGEKAIFTTAGDLYEFAVDTNATRLIAHDVAGLLGTSEDASRIYFASSEALAPGATAGKRNLYLYESEGDGRYVFIAELSAQDSSAIANEPWLRTSRVTEDGSHLAFMSVASPTGYDNHDSHTGDPTAQVYLYDASAGDEGRLVCASCNPSGSRPSGGAELPVWQNVLTPGQVLSEDGSRLYFQTVDSLNLRDSNDRVDVYQWETNHTGGCDEGDAGYVADSDGCVELISSGQSNRDSEFIEASPTGDDVFFATLSGLVSQDYGLVDIYDARVNGGLPGPVAAPPECEGESCQDPPPAPQFQTPSSSAYTGPANLSGSKKPPQCAKGKHRVRKKGKARCEKLKKPSKKRKRAAKKAARPRSVGR